MRDRSRLVLARKAGQSVDIGPITITVVENSGGVTRFAIEAPREMNITRDDGKSGPKDGPQSVEPT
jgi:carbon storage regulator CsrA